MPSDAASSVNEFFSAVTVAAQEKSKPKVVPVKGEHAPAVYKFPKEWRRRHVEISSPILKQLADAVNNSEMTVHQIAAESGIGVATIRKIAYYDHGGSPWVSTVLALARTLNISVK